MGMLYVVGLGPGDPAGMTAAADAALARAEVIVGYGSYIDLLDGRYPQAERVSTPMMREIERCRRALELACERDVVAMVCSGDAGVYGMAAPVLELSVDYPDVDIEVVPGVTAAMSGSAVLGAPLAHDFAVISLSDLLTPWEVIERRLEAAAWSDMCICLYNPRSKKRADYLARAAQIIGRHKVADTVCGWVRNIGRAGEEHGLTTLGELADLDADMFTTVFIGSAQTRVVAGRMVTPRGYRELADAVGVR
ncbi:precorrin-3B C(17)-methyltransferase [Collinsella tanakaei]|uniref:precorrin-3B C(17)-methyltransferase n=1 Tax=Collinsella tanakaei TaxID=626935 RepID=UPI0025A4965B|nr:precorrin-3B C(17)-methyltransferase [Collinsella tanakaei]MDM8245739.1 precorrin-3B C(17)-methyltransferase [Collinsella tanakaei]